MPSGNPSDVHNINNVVGGDVIQQYGSGNVGKQVHTGSGDNVAGHKNPFGSGFPMPATVIVNDGDYVAQDKTATHFGNVSHNLGSGPDNSPDAQRE